MASTYQNQVASQVAQYATVDNIHDLPKIFHYWSNRYLLPRVRSVLGVDSPAEFYAAYISEATHRSGNTTVLSVGAGDASEEIRVLEALRSRGITNLQIRCLEISPILVNRALANVQRAGLGESLSFVQHDANSGVPVLPVAAVMAHHSLHHILNLETLFESVKRATAPAGMFLTCDMIGRNGHMRWPESLTAVRDLFQNLPRQLKYNHALKKYDAWFENWDCSIEGFEGIRAQDILQLLDKNFRIERFLAWGGLVDPFIDRGFGPNFSPEIAEERSFIDRLQEAEDRLLDLNVITPTQMWAVMTADNRTAPPIVWRQLTPQRCIRDSQATRPSANLESVGFKSPYSLEPKTDSKAARISFGRTIRFRAHRRVARHIRRWGWSEPEKDFTWGIGEESAITLSLPSVMAEEAITAHFRTFGCLTAARPEQRVSVFFNGRLGGEILHGPGRSNETEIRIPSEVITELSAPLTITFRPSHWWRPDVDGTEERRPISFALISFSVETIPDRARGIRRFLQFRK